MLLVPTIWEARSVGPDTRTRQTDASVGSVVSSKLF